MVVLNGCMAPNVQRTAFASRSILRYLTGFGMTDIKKKREDSAWSIAAIANAKGGKGSLNPKTALVGK